VEVHLPEVQAGKCTSRTCMSTDAAPPRPVAQRVLLLRSRQGRCDAEAGVCGRSEGHRARGGAAQGTSRRRDHSDVRLLGELGVARGGGQSANRRDHPDGRRPWAFNESGPHQRFHIENIKAALDSPGEWFLDRGGDLFYIPLPAKT